MIFIDTGAFLARHIKRDQFHDKAVRAWATIATNGPPCFTSNFVLSETMTLLARRAGAEFAAERGRLIHTSKVLTILRPGRDEELNALGLLTKYADQKASHTDCISFALMRKRRIRLAFTFDRHFAVAGFELWPSGL